MTFWRHMHPLYRDYIWQKGVPVGRGTLTNTDLSTVPMAYKIIVDPYRKRFSIERYQNTLFDRLVYDSLLLDFRHLKPADQQGWQRETLSQADKEAVCLIRNQEERLLYREHHTFEGVLCRECRITSLQGVLLSTHRMYYTTLGDAFDGTLLYDSNDHLVLAKRYTCSPSGEFLELLEERWDQADPSYLSRWQSQLKASEAR